MVLKVMAASVLPGKTIETSGLARTHGVKVVAIGRKGSIITNAPLSF